MNEEFGGDFITVTDEDGTELELELLDVVEKDDTIYHAFIPAGAGEAGDEEEVEIVLLKVVEENGEEFLSTLDSEEEIEAVYNLFMERLFEDEDDE